MNYGMKSLHGLLLLCMAMLLGGCNNEDNVTDIFVGSNKTWKLTFISKENSNMQFDFWGGNETARENSMKALASDENFILNFEGGEVNGVTGGGLSGRAVKAALQGTWNVPEGRELRITLRNEPSESDPLAKAFVKGLQGATRYGGDNSNLYIYYDDGQATLRMTFHVQK